MGRGLNRGDRVCVIADNSIEYAVLIFAAYRIGATLVPLNTRLSQRAWTGCMKKAECRLLLADQRRTAFARSSGCEFILLGDSIPDGSNRIGAFPHEIISSEIPLDLEASIPFTSGSEGFPKGAILTFANHYCSALASNENIPLSREDCWLASLPFFHVGGMAILFRAAVAGCSVHVVSNIDFGSINMLIDRGMVTHLSLVPTMLRSLLAARGYRATPGTLKAILLGGEPIPGSLLQDINRLALPVLTTYGLTESASQVCTMSPNDSRDRLQSSGRPLRYSEITILNSEGEPTDRGAVGEIAIRGRIVFKGYLPTQEGSCTSEPGGWFRTGDSGYLDKNGYLYVRGRVDDMFVSGGENIYPSEIEMVASEFPGVSECGVVAVDDSTWGKRPVLFIKRDKAADASLQELRTWLQTRLSRIQMPEAIIEVDEFPRKSIDKIDKEALRKSYLRGSER
jgi:O-succinylbenzoic acid--CoA ligase